jgi:hypothetical protein
LEQLFSSAVSFGIRTDSYEQSRRDGVLSSAQRRNQAMQCNVGGVDRTGRIVIGIVLLLLGLLAPMSVGWKVLVFVLAAVALITATIRFCPANYLLGINTCGPKSRS